MTQVEQLALAVRALPRPEFEAFKVWLSEYEYELWSDQIERDSYDGNSPIMKLATQALLEHKKRKTREL